MKKIIFVFLLSVVFFSCNRSQEEILPEDTKLSEIEEGVITFLDVKGVNEVLIIFKTQRGFDWKVEQEAGLKNGKHDYESKSKYALAKWVDTQLDAGKCVKVGKTGSTYWGDIVDC